MKEMKGVAPVAIAVIIIVVVIAAAAAYLYLRPPEEKPLILLSTQMVPIKEADWVRTELFPPFEQEFGIDIEFVPSEYGPWSDRILAEYQAKRGRVGVVIGLHGDFPVITAEGAMKDLGEFPALTGRTFPEAFMELGVMEGIQAYIPMMQATYLMAANKKALDYLPAGADKDALTYDQLIEWAKNMYEATGEKKFGLPGGPKGLLHRFVHGYLYPSFTGKQVAKFNSPEAVTMWEKMKKLWTYTHPSSVLYEHMYEPLLTEEVWVAWDHTARLKTALEKKPADFVVLPSPAGPAGRSFIAVLVGLGIPEMSPLPDEAWKFIEYATRPEVQVEILEGVGFFPVVTEASGVIPLGPLKALGEAVSKQAAAADAIPALLPIGLGGRAGEFTPIYRDAFTAIVIDGEPIQTVLDRQGALLTALYEETGAPYPPPG